MGANGDGKGGGPVPDGGAGEDPDAVLRPALKLVEDEARGVQLVDGGLAVGAIRFDKVQLVVNDFPRAPLPGRLPVDLDGRGTYRFSGHVLRRCARYYGGVFAISQSHKRENTMHTLCRAHRVRVV